MKTQSEATAPELADSRIAESGPGPVGSPTPNNLDDPPPDPTRPVRQSSLEASELPLEKLSPYAIALGLEQPWSDRLDCGLQRALIETLQPNSYYGTSRSRKLS